MYFHLFHLLISIASISIYFQLIQCPALPVVTRPQAWPLLSLPASLVYSCQRLVNSWGLQASPASKYPPTNQQTKYTNITPFEKQLWKKNMKKNYSTPSLISYLYNFINIFSLGGFNGQRSWCQQWSVPPRVQSLQVAQTGPKHRNAPAFPTDYWWPKWSSGRIGKNQPTNNHPSLKSWWVGWMSWWSPVIHFEITTCLARYIWPASNSCTSNLHNFQEVFQSLVLLVINIWAVFRFFMVTWVQHVFFQYSCNNTIR